LLIKIKKRKMVFLIGFYGRFLSIKSANATPTTMIATNSPAIAGAKYWSAMDGAAVGAGEAVGAGSLVWKAVEAEAG
jgi:hypothetical protein